MQGTAAPCYQWESSKQNKIVLHKTCQCCEENHFATVKKCYNYTYFSATRTCQHNSQVLRLWHSERKQLDAKLVRLSTGLTSMSPSPTAELGNMKLLLQAFFFEDGGGNEHRQIWNLDRNHTEPQWQARLGHLGSFQSLQRITDPVFSPIG